MANAQRIPETEPVEAVGHVVRYDITEGQIQEANQRVPELLKAWSEAVRDA